MRRPLGLLFVSLALLAPSTTVTVLTADQASAASCSCPVGPYVDPSTSEVTSQDGASPNGVYQVVATPGVDSSIRLSVIRASTKASVFSQTVPGNTFWGFSPDDDRFVYHYLSGNVDNVFLYSLAGSTTSLIWTTTQTTTASRIAFSPHGRYLLYEATQGSNDSMMTVVDATTHGSQPAYSRQFSFVSAAGTVEDSFGVVGWGFSSEGGDSSLVFAFMNGQSTADWNIVHFTPSAAGASAALVHEETINVIAAFWQFSPCGDLIAIATQPSQTRVDVRLLSTTTGALVPNSNQGFDLAAVSFRSALDPASASTVHHFVSVGGHDHLLASLQTTACVPPPSLASITLTPASVVGGQTVAGKLTLTVPAPSGGAAVSISTNNPAAVTLPASITVPAGSTNASFSMQTSSAVTGFTAVTISAAYGGVVRRASLSIIPKVSVSLSSLSLPTVARGHEVATGTVTLSGRTPTQFTIALVSSDAQVKVPASVTVPIGAGAAAFTIAADINTAGHVTVTATYAGDVRSGVIAVFPARLDYLDTFCPHTVIGGGTVSAGLSLDALAGSPGRSVTFTSSHPSVVPAPPGITVATGQRQVSFVLQTNAVTAPTIVTIFATDGEMKRSATVNVTVAGSGFGTGPWQQVCPAGPLPTPRDWASTTYDSARGNVVLFGGEDAGGQFRNDTWIWDGSTWTEQHPGAFPQKRYGAAMAFDEAAGIALLYGGQGEGADYLQDTWAWDGSSWTELDATSPPGMLFSPMMAYDRATDSIVLFGGAANDSSIPESPDTWTWKHGTWTRHVTAVHPHPGDQTNAFAYDPITKTVLLVEGNCELAPSANCDTSPTGGQTWSWDGTTWTPLNPKVNPPRAIGVGFAYAAAANRMILFGINADTWQWDGTNWSRFPTPGGAPCPRDLQAMSRQPDTGGVILFGGLGISPDATCQTTTDWNDTWLFTPATAATPPAANPQPNVAGISPSAGRAGGPSFTLVVNGDHFVKGSSVLWNGSSRPTTLINNMQLTAAIPASDLAISGELAVARITVSNPGPGGGISTPLPFTIGSGKIRTATSVTASSSKTASASAVPTLADQAGLAATLTNNGDQPAVLTVASYAVNPTGVQVFDRGGGFVDLQVSGAVPSDVVRANFYYPSTTTGKPRSALSLRYFNGTGWAPVRSSGGVPPLNDNTGNLANTISAKFDSTSTPSVSALGGTVFGMLVVDTTPPVITPALSGAPNQAGWFNHDVSISWTVDDPESGIASSSGCLPVRLSAETAGTTVTCVATNGAGMKASRSVTVRIDKTPPVTTAIASPIADQAGVNSSDVTVRLRAADNPAGSGIDQVHFDLAGAQTGSGVVNGSIATISITAPGTTTLTYFATDLAGNHETPNTLIIRIKRMAAAPPSFDRTPSVASLAQTGGIGGRVAIGLIIMAFGLVLLPRRGWPVRRVMRRGPSQPERS